AFLGLSAICPLQGRGITPLPRAGFYSSPVEGWQAQPDGVVGGFPAFPRGDILPGTNTLRAIALRKGQTIPAFVVPLSYSQGSKLMGGQIMAATAFVRRGLMKR
ncbi:MAG: hypothetical protein LBU43_07680, partial [Candidatus Accumulibacter sp.]|nr:hypothetical protein [Accumulibacter sp.]